MSIDRLGLWCGVAAPLVYLIGVIAGGELVPGYDHLRDAISSLTESGRVLGVTAVGGLLMFIFPMDPVGQPMSQGGMAHILLAAILSLSTMGAIAVVGLGAFRRRRPSRALFSGLILIVVAASGAAAGMGAAAGWPLMGLLERLTIGGSRSGSWSRR